MPALVAYRPRRPIKNKKLNLKFDPMWSAVGKRSGDTAFNEHVSPQAKAA